MHHGHVEQMIHSRTNESTRNEAHCMTHCIPPRNSIIPLVVHRSSFATFILMQLQNIQISLFIHEMLPHQWTLPLDS